MSRKRRFRGGRLDLKIEDVVVVGLERGLTLTNSFAVSADDGITNANWDRLSNVVFASDVTMPSSFSSNGIIMESGGATVGCGVGLVNDGKTLRFISGDGSATPDLSVTAILDIDTSIFIPGSSGTLVWDFRISPGRVRAWWNGVFLGEGTTSAGANLKADAWSGTAAMTYGAATATTVTGSLVADVWPGTINSNLRYYTNQQVSNSAEAYQPGGIFDLTSVYFTKI